MTVASTPVASDISAQITFDGTMLPQDVSNLLRSFRLERGVRMVGRAELTFTDTELALLDQKSTLFKVGAAVVVTATLGGTSSQVFDGLVTGVRADYLAPEWSMAPPVLTVVAEERTSELRQRQETKVFTGVTSAQVLTQLCAVNGMTVSVGQGAFPSTKHDTFLNTASPLVLLENLCETYGAEWWLEGKTLHVGQAASAGQVTVPLPDLVASLSLETRNAGTTSVRVRGWDRVQKAPVVGQQDGDVSADPAAAAAPNSTIDRPMGDPTRPVDTRARQLDGQEELTAHAKGIALRAARQRHDLQLETLVMVPDIGPRTTLNLTQAGALTGTYRVTTVVQYWDEHGGRTKVFCGSRAAAALAPALSAGAGARVDTGTLLVGLVTSISPTQSKDEGCVQVKFPTLGDSVGSAWARVVVPGGGANRGFVVPHQVNDEVIVGFEEGDLQRPVVLGAVHGGQAAPPSATAPIDGEARTAGLTSKNGHVVLVTDEEDAAKNGILVKHTKGSNVLLNDQGITVEGTEVPVTVKVGAASVVVDKQGNVTIKGTKVVLEGTAEVEIKAPTVKVAANAQLDIQSSATAALKAQASLEMSSSGLTQVKGSLLKLN